MDLFEKITLKEVAKILNRKFIGSENHFIHGLSEIHNVQKGDLIYCDHPKYYKLALNSQADTIIINDEVIFCENLFELRSLRSQDDVITLNAPTARCLQLLLDKAGQVVSRDDFLTQVWQARGIVVSQNTFYQNISLLSTASSLHSASHRILAESCPMPRSLCKSSTTSRSSFTR